MLLTQNRKRMRINYILRYGSNRLLLIYVYHQRSEIEQEQEKQQSKKSNNDAKG
jgi:hypothetical protein